MLLKNQAFRWGNALEKSHLEEKYGKTPLFIAGKQFEEDIIMKQETTVSLIFIIACQ